MKSTSRTNKASLQGMATGRALLLVFAVNLATSGFVFSANANERKTAIITFDVPGAGTGPFQGTQGLAISPEGTITGPYFDSGNVTHGYVRARDGTIITFDAPGAGTGPGQGTGSESINPAGTITGIYNDANGLFHGFVRAADGVITTFDAPGQGTLSAGINRDGSVP
jgi:hypothetical protein